MISVYFVRENLMTHLSRGKIIGELLKKFEGHMYFLGGQYAANIENIFTDYFQCGLEGLNNPKSSLEIATNELIKVLKKH
jgi:hypothetical protein